MNEFTSNSQIYTIATEKEVSNILSHFNSGYIMDVINDKLNKKLQYIGVPNPNIVASFEVNFNQILNDYSFDRDTILKTRDDTYLEIINILCNHYNLSFNNDETIDHFSAANLLYDLLISNFATYLSQFFCNYIVAEKDSIYSSLNLEELKKNKDSSTSYNKKIYTDPKIAIISSNIAMVLDQISTYDITLYDIIRSVYPSIQLSDFLCNTIVDNQNFFQTFYINLIRNEYDRPNILTDIRLRLQSFAISGYSTMLFKQGEE